jgi:hypothetical protein
MRALGPVSGCESVLRAVEDGGGGEAAGWAGEDEGRKSWSRAERVGGGKRVGVEMC